MKRFNNREAGVVYYLANVVRLYLYIYMFVCPELIEEASRLPGLIFGLLGYFLAGLENFEFWTKI